MIPAAIDPATLRIAGLTRLSTVDWPDRLVATVFLQGCPWDCFYCHNPALRAPRAPAAMSWQTLRAFLKKRRGLLDGVVFSGGEPTMQPALPAAIAAVRQLGFAVGLHTAGIYPAALARILPYVDWVGLDIKTSKRLYEKVTGYSNSAERSWGSLSVVLAESAARADTNRPLDYEVRTTVHPEAADAAELAVLGHRLADAGVTCWALQRFRSEGTRIPLPRVGEPSYEVSLDAVPGERFARFAVR